MLINPSKPNRFLKKGMSLIEIVVAIGISIVTMTGAAVFSNSLLIRAQENFAESSALQLQNLLSEQIRILELAMKKDIKRPTVTLETGGYVNSTMWKRLCSEALGDNNVFLKLNFPTLNSDTNQKVSITNINNSEISHKPTQGEAKDYIFYKFDDLPRFGAFDNESPVDISIKKEIDRSLGTNDALKSIKFTTFVSYEVLGQRKYTKSQELKIVHSLVCNKNP